MVKARSQTVNIAIKKEDEQDVKNIQPVPSVSNAVKSGKITKQKVPKRKSSLPPAILVKMEEDINIKPLLEASPTFSTPGRPQDISQQQIAQLIRYVVKDKMALYKASKKSKNRVYNGILLLQFIQERSRK
jgi:hypothetical protein